MIVRDAGACHPTRIGLPAMANKALSKRQKLTIRIEPSQKAPRNPFALAAKQRVAGPHQKSVAARRQLEKRLLQQKLKAGKPPESEDD